MTISVSTCAPWAEPTHAAIDPAVTFEDGILESALQIASDILFEFTNQRWPGECTETIRPVGCGCRGYGPAVYGSTVSHVVGAGPRWFVGTHSSGVSEIRLPGYPVVGVDEVKIDGDVIDAARYRIDNNRTLVYLPASTSAVRQSWPCSQDMKLDSDQVDTFEVTYRYGTLPDVGGQFAAARLGFELALAFDPKADPTRSQLPQRVTQIVTRGQTLAMIDPLDLFEKRKTGLAEVDLWAAAKNGATTGQQATVFYPGQQRSARRTGT